MEEKPGDGQAYPNDESEQAHHVDSCQSSNAFLPKTSDVRANANGEKGEHEEKDAGNVCPGNHRLRGRNVRLGLQAIAKNKNKGQHVPENKFRKSLPYLTNPHFVA